VNRDRIQNGGHPEDCLLSPASIDRLRRKGVHGSDWPFYHPSHLLCPSGYRVILPANVPGNHYPGPDNGYFTDQSGNYREVNTPAVSVWGKGPVWQVCVSEYAPGPGPGDFSESFNSQDDAIHAVLDFFFNPENEHFVAGLRAERLDS